MIGHSDLRVLSGGAHCSRNARRVLDFEVFFYTTFSDESGLLGVKYRPGDDQKSPFGACECCFRDCYVVRESLGKLAFYH